MKNKKIFRTFAALCTCLMLMGGFSVTAFAQGADPAPTATPAADATNDSNVVVEETEDTPPLTPEGNAALVDDYGRQQAAHHRHHQGGQLLLYPHRPCQRGQGNRRPLLKPGGRGRLDGADGGRRDYTGSPCRLQLHGKMRRRCGGHGLPGLCREHGRVYTLDRVFP